MPAKDYERLSIERFGTRLLDSGDLDPIYVMLRSFKLQGCGVNYLRRWLLAYWCYYHAGVACFMADRAGDSYWWWMMAAAFNQAHCPLGINARWPRGPERRHFRGANATKAVAMLQRDCPDPEGFSVHLEEIGEDSMRFVDVRRAVMEYHSFGPWIAFKVADMLERVMAVPISFEAGEVFMYDQPHKAALELYGEHFGTMGGEGRTEPEKVAWSVNYLLEYFGDRQAPPGLDRPVGIQEVETILCKWKSHMGGHYPLNNDITELFHAVETWAAETDGIPVSNSAKDMLRHLRQELS